MGTEKTGQWRYRSLFALLVICVLVLCLQLGYFYVADVNRFPVNTVKIAASFQRVSRQQIEQVLSNYQSYSYFSLPIARLQKELLKFEWADEVSVVRVWPDILSIKLIEKEPVASWNNSLVSADGRLFDVGALHKDLGLPELKGPEFQKNGVLQIYQKLSKLLLTFGLHVALLQLHENQSWDLTLTNGVNLRLGKQDIEKRLERFCKAYRASFAEKYEQLASVDLRYERGMAIQWRQQKGR